MAKQNVTFVERHLEKVVVGVTGTILLAIAVLYLVGTPHQVEVQGEFVGPQKLYDAIRSQADATREMLKRADYTPPEAPTGSVVVADPDKQTSPYTALNLPREFAVSPAPLAPAVPEAQGAQRGKIRLAEILPPTSIKVTAGMASMKLPEPTLVESPQGGGATPVESNAVTEDHSWAVVAAVISRKEQRAKFDQAHYTVERQNLVVAGVEAEREERLPDGQWGGRTVVTGYSEAVIPVRRTAEMTPQDDGTAIIATTESNAVDQYRQLLASPDAQSRIVRPPFQHLLDIPIVWQVPAELPAADGVTVKLAEFGAIVEEVGANRPGARTRPAGAGAGGETLGQASPNLSPPQILQQATKLINEKKFLEAEALLRQVEGITDAPATLKSKAKSMLAAIQKDVDRARTETLRKERIAAASKDLGPDNEPLWLTDLTVQPGKTYRYRVRLLAFNPYVGNILQLENPQDAGRVVTEGKWSAWSDPVPVKATTHLFFTSLKEESGTANIVIRSFENGSWQASTKKGGVGVGDPAASDPGRRTVCYADALVAELIPKIASPERSAKGGDIAYIDKPTSALVLITADGQVEERTASGDAQRKNLLEREIAEDRKRLEAAPSESHLRPAAPPDRPPPRTGGPFGPMDEMGPGRK